MNHAFHTWRLDWPPGLGARVLTGVGRGAAVVLLGLIGLIHLVQASLYAQGAPYIGVLFSLACVGSWLAALSIAVGIRGAWVLGALVAAGTFAGLLVAATVGLPGFMDSLDAPMAMRSLVVEALFIVLYVAVAAFRRDPLGA
jgi:hypothetical protein